MGLFSKKKEPEVKPELPPLKFPELPSEQKEQVAQPAQPQAEEISPKEEQIIKEAIAPAKPAVEEKPIPKMEEEKPLFVKIEKYKEVMTTLSELKSKLKNASDILNELDKIKEDEEKELASWHSDLEAIKERLMKIDQTLFEI